MSVSSVTQSSILNTKTPTIDPKRESNFFAVQDSYAEIINNRKLNLDGSSLHSIFTEFSPEGSTQEGSMVGVIKSSANEIYKASSLSSLPFPCLSGDLSDDLMSCTDDFLSFEEINSLPVDIITDNSSDFIDCFPENKTNFRNLPRLDVLITKTEAQSKHLPTFERSFSAPATCSSTSTKDIQSEGKQVFQTEHQFPDSNSEKYNVTTSHDSTEDFISTKVQSKLLTKLVLDKDNSESVELEAPEFVKPQIRSLRRKENNRTATSTEICDGSDETTNDFEILTAVQKSITQGSMMPILKKELQTKLQYERLLRGDSEIVLVEETPRRYELRPDEIEKRDRRLSQNRESARRCRLKLKKQKHDLQKVIKQEMTLQAKIQKEIERLKQERNTLSKIIEKHKKCCVLTVKKSNQLIGLTLHSPDIQDL